MRSSPQDSRWKRASTWLALWALAVVVVCGTLVVLALGPDALWRTAAHESEPRSLLRTAYFPGHALRELPHLLVLALAFLAGAAPAQGRVDLLARLRLLLAFGAVATALLGLAAMTEEGWSAASADLAQTRGAPDLVGPGVHIRMHLASDLALGGLFFAAGAAIRTTQRPQGGSGAAPLVLAGAMLVAMALKAGFEGVASPRFVGHAAREVEAHALVTLPALLAATLARPDARVDLAAALRRTPVQAALALTTLVAGWLAWRASGIDLRLHSSSPGRAWWLNLAVHHFEHLIDLALLLTATALWRRAGAHRSAAT